MTDKTITKEQFEDYVRVQKSGVTNMFDVTYVSFLTSLEKDQILYIMENYEALNTKYNVL